MSRIFRTGVASKFEMSFEEMEERIGRKIGTFEKIITLNDCSVYPQEWHFINNVWVNSSI